MPIRRLTDLSAILALSFLLAACNSGPSANRGGSSNDTPVDTPDPCAADGSDLVTGTVTIDEQYSEGSGAAQFEATSAGCWKSYRAHFTPMQESDFVTEFVSDTVDGVTQNARKLTVTARSGIETNADVDYSPHLTPDTGLDTGKWPYVIDLFKDTQCYGDVTVTAQLKPATSPTGAEIYGLLVNANVTGQGPSRRITGYLIHLNGGGVSGTLVKIDQGSDHAFDYLDRFPGYQGRPNPITDGPYKGWDFKNTMWSAGGFPNESAEVTAVARYRYNSVASTATIDWELRPASGVDGSPGTFDMTRTLSGSDALPPGGGYGVYTALYGSLALGTFNSLTVGGFRLDCTN